RAVLRRSLTAKGISRSECLKSSIRGTSLHRSSTLFICWPLVNLSISPPQDMTANKHAQKKIADDRFFIISPPFYKLTPSRGKIEPQSRTTQQIITGELKWYLYFFGTSFGSVRTRKFANEFASKSFAAGNPDRRG